LGYGVKTATAEETGLLLGYVAFMSVDGMKYFGFFCATAFTLKEP
jgi:hypothetical protein